MISIIVPVFKVEQYLPNCIESIMNQTYRDLEILLIDDGSPDDSGKICDLYAKKDKRIKVFHKNNGGLSDARNYGIAKARGDYLGFIDSDDWVEPDMFALLMNIAEETHADIVNCGFYYEYPRYTRTASAIDKEFTDHLKLIKALILGDINVQFWNKIYRKSLFTELSFPKGHIYEDVRLMHHLFLKSAVVVCNSKPLYHYRKERKGAITQDNSMANLIDDWLAQISRYEYFFCDNRFNKDKEIMDKLCYFCASAIVRTWRWCYTCTNQERKQYATYLRDMHSFCVHKIPFFGMKKWPLRVRMPLIFCRFNNRVSFALLYYLLESYRLIKNNLLKS